MSRFLPSIPGLTLTAVIDILVVAFLVYQGLMVVRGTRAGHILVGILIMVSLYGLALWAGLEALRVAAGVHRAVYRAGGDRAVSVGNPPHAGAARP